MTNEHSKNENLFSDKSHEVIGKLGIGFSKVNNKLTNLLEENQGLKQQCKNFQQINSDLKGKLQEKDEKFENLHQLFQNLEKQKYELIQQNQMLEQQCENLQQQHQEILQVNSDLKERLQEKNKNFEELQQCFQNLEKRKNDEIQKLEIISQNLAKNLEILELEEINEDDINYLKESNKSLIDQIIEQDYTFQDIENHSFDGRDIRIVVGLDFGTTYSGFAYCHVRDGDNVCTNDIWPGGVGPLRTNTILRYDDEYNNVKLWGASALARRPNRRNRNRNNNEGNKLVELFRLHLGNLSEEHKPKLPVDYKKAITDYLREIGKVIKEAISTRWPKIDYFEQVLLVLTIPAEFPEKSKAIMRTCAFNAGLIKEEYSITLQFTTEQKATALYCVEDLLKRHVLERSETNFMIADCGGTVDLTTWKLINKEQLGGITVRSSDFCGSTYIDEEFITYLRERLGDEPMDLLRDNNYGQMQYLIQEFCKFAKIPFTGEDPYFLYELDIQDTIPILKQYVTDDNVRETLEEEEWLIEIDTERMKSMFEPVVQKILRLIRAQLDSAQGTCSALSLVGELIESKYLQKRIIEEFQDQVKIISVPIQPIASIARGAVIYGKSRLSTEKN